MNRILGCETGWGCVVIVREGSAGNAVPPNHWVGSVRMCVWFPWHSTAPQDITCGAVEMRRTRLLDVMCRYGRGAANRDGGVAQEPVPASAMKGRGCITNIGRTQTRQT